MKCLGESTRKNDIVKFRKNKLLGKIIHTILLNKGLDLPAKVQLGKNVRFPHNSVGTVIHPNTIIEDNVWIYQNVTIGRANVTDFSDDRDLQIVIKKGAILCAGAKILCKKKIEVGENTIISANAVLLESTGDNQVWVGVPARRIK